MNANIHFRGTITTVQGYASATPSLAKSVKSGQATPVTRSIKDGGSVLAILSSSIKGTLRRASADVAFLYQQEKDNTDKPMTLSAHKLNRTGGTKSKGDSDRVTPDDLVKINESQLIVGIFGAGDPFIAGKLSVDAAYAEHNEAEVVDGVRSDDFLRNPELLMNLDDEGLAEFLGNTANVSEASKLKKERKELMTAIYKESDANHKVKLDKKLKALDDKLSKFTLVSTQLPLAGYERIPAGEKLSHYMRLAQKDSALQLGFLLESLNYLSYNPLMGAKKNNGCGEFAMEYAVTKTAYKQEVEHLGTIKVIPYAGVEITGEYLENALAEFKAAADKHQFDFTEIK
jgi:hypothetical protein